MMSVVRNRRYDADPEAIARNYRFMQRKALLSARSAIPVEEYQDFLDWFLSQTALESSLVRSLPVGMDYLTGVVTAPRVSLLKEVAWLTSRLSSVSSHLNSFVELGQNLQALIWSGSEDEIFDALDLIEKLLGQSMWLLSLRIAAEQAYKGIEAQKAYVGSATGYLKRGLVKYIAHWISARNEPSVSWSWFLEDMGRRIRQSRYDDSIKTYLNYRLTGLWPTSYDMMSDVLRIEQSHSDLDLYETFVSFVQNAVTDRLADPQLRAVISSSLSRLAGISDPRLEKARRILGISTAELPTLKCTAGEALANGNLKEAVRTSARRLREEPTSLEDALVLAFARAGLSAAPKSSSRLRLSPLWEDAVNQMSLIFLKGEEFEAAHDRLRKLGSNFGGTAIGQAILGVAASEQSGDLLNTASALRAVAFNREAVTFSDARADLASMPEPADLAGEFFSFAHGRRPAPTGLDPSVAAFGNAVAAARRTDWKAAADHAAVAAETSVEPLRRRALLLRLASAIRLDAVDEVIKATEAEVATGGVNPELIPHARLVEGRPWSELRGSGGRIGLAITLDLAFKATGDDRIATYRRFAYDLFLSKRGVEKASHLDPAALGPRSLLYFLRNVAVPSVLDMSEALGGTREVQIERREILSMLMTLDPEHSVEYQEEILDITDRLAVAEGLRLVDSSRIHVDTDAIEDWAARELRDGFRRYRNLVKNGIGVADDFEAVLHDLRKKDESAKYLFSVPNNEADDLLVSLINSLLIRFLNDPAHGLDSYLSRRIRHGSIVGFLRGPVEQEGLVTLRDESTGEYARNVRWLSALPDLTEDETAEISAAMREFAREFDDALIDLRDNVIQLKGADHPRGIFDVVLYADQYHLIRSALRDVDSAATFVSLCFASFWSILDRNLWHARTLIKEDLRTKLADAFSRLRGTLSRLQGPPRDLLGGATMAPREGLGDLSVAITAAQTGTQAALEDAAAWFTRSEVQLASRVYDLHDAVNIAIQSALARLRRYDPDISMQTEEGVSVLATDLSVIADIVLITLGNACERSGIPSGVKFVLKVGLNDAGDLLCFDAENDVAAHRRRAEHRAIVDGIRAEIAAGSTTDLARGERRSGLRKLGALTIRYPAARLAFGFTEHDSFEVHLKVPYDTKAIPPHTEEGQADASADS